MRRLSGMRSREATTSFASRFLPLWNFTPLRIGKTYVFPSSLDLHAFGELRDRLRILVAGVESLENVRA